MKKIEANETTIIGQNILVQGRIAGDDASQRIADLVTTHLTKLGHDQSGWDTLYRDPYDGRLWELIYPQSELQGGGPPSLVVISQDAAAAKYKV
jgi:hypothetical protein